MQFRDEQEPDQFDNYYTQEELNGHPDDAPTPPQSPEPAQTPAPKTASPQREDASTHQILKEAARKLSTAAADFIDHHSAHANSEKTIRQMQSLARTIKDLQQITKKHRRPGRPKNRKKALSNAQEPPADH